MKIDARSLLTALAAGALCLYAAESWESKDPGQWSSDEIQKVLTDSPWAKQIKGETPQQGGNRGGGRRMGGMGGGFPGGGMGGGGMGGGGYGGRGGGMGGGGNGGYGGSDSGGYGGGAPINVTLRWESALPVQLAQNRLKSTDAASADSKPAANPEAKADSKPDAKDSAPAADPKPYVLLLSGLTIPRPRDTDADQDQDSQTRRRPPTAEAFREQLLENTRLSIKGKSSLTPTDVKLDANRGEARIMFRRDEPISLDDKEVTFESRIGRAKLEKKFKLKEMVYQGKLEL